MRPTMPCSTRKRLAFVGVSVSGLTAMASAGTSRPSRSSPILICWAWAGQVSSQVV